MNFRIVENQSVHDTYDLNELIEDYKNMELTVKEIREKYNLTVGQWHTVLKRIKEQGVSLRGASYRNAKYYSFNKQYNHFRVHRVINGVHYRFGAYRTEKEAKARVDELNANNWEGLLV